MVVKTKYWRMLVLAGAYIATIIGAGFASGQEILQFFTSFGYLGIIGIVISTVLFAWYGSSFMVLGKRLDARGHAPVLRYLCGKYVGTVFEWIITFFLFGVFAIMISGGGAALTQHFGFPGVTGRIFMALICMITVLLGLRVMVSAISVVAPAAVVISIVVAIYAVATSGNNLSVVPDTLAGMSLHKAAFNWFFSSLIYVSYCVLPAVPVLAAMGADEEDISVSRRAGIIGGLALGVGAVALNLAMLSRLQDVGGEEIPVLYLANTMTPILGWIFVFVLLGAIYSTGSPILYGFVARFTRPQTRPYYILTVATTIAAFIAGLFPFSTLIGTIYPVFGWLGLVVMASVVWKMIIGKGRLAPDSGRDPVERT